MPLYLFQLGDNGLEELFSLLRTLTHQRNMDALMFKHNVCILARLQAIYESHPEWKKQ
jgi:hypothetical protein